ncbi:MAG: DNA-methyltransferase [Pirellulales bacterium]
MKLNQVVQGDSLHLLAKLPAESVDLVFADPPFNIGYEYDVYEDRKGRETYLQWTDGWIAAARRVLKPAGSFWLAIGDEYAAECKILLEKHDLHLRNWIVWHYTFGVNCKSKFNRSHAHLFYTVADSKRFTFNADDPAVRVPSARQTTYNDRRANAAGKLPDDTWVLRPQEEPRAFLPDTDTWYFARVCGTFKEREGWHPCQMPEQLLGRIIRVASNPGDLVLDPFAGSGTTLVVAKKLNRRWLGFELSEQYAGQAQKRLESAVVGAPLDGYVEGELRFDPRQRTFFSHRTET